MIREKHDSLTSSHFLSILFYRQRFPTYGKNSCGSAEQTEMNYLELLFSL